MAGEMSRPGVSVKPFPEETFEHANTHLDVQHQLDTWVNKLMLKYTGNLSKSAY